MVLLDSTYKHPPNQPRRQLNEKRARSGYGFLAGVIEGVIAHAGPLLEKLEEPHRHGGNPGDPAKAMLSACILQFTLKKRYANGFLVELDRDPQLLNLCGLAAAPSESAYCRFKQRLAQHQDLFEAGQITSGIVAEINDEIECLREVSVVPAEAPGLGEYIAIDSTDIEAYGNPNRKEPADQDAAWGHRTPKNKSSAKNKELFYGYKNHEAGDAYYGLPLGGITLPAKAGDGPQLPQVLAEVQRLHPWLQPRYGIADKAYAGQKRLQHLVNRGIIPVVAVPRPREDETGQRLYDGIYTADGRPTCIGSQPMEYLMSDPEKGHLFRCPDGGCPLQGKVDWSRYCDDEVWEKPEGKLLRIIGILPRCTNQWKRIYRMRTAIERYFRSAKHSRLLDQHQHLGLSKVSLHVKIARLAYLATALARLKADDYAGMRQMSVNLPGARPAQGRPPTDTGDPVPGLPLALAA